MITTLSIYSKFSNHDILYSLFGELVILIAVSSLSGSMLSSVATVGAQNMTNASNLTEIENSTSSASVTARLNTTTPIPESDDYPTPSPIDQ